MIKAIIFDCFGVLYPDTYWTMAREFLGTRFEKEKPELHALVRRVDMGQITRDELWNEFAGLVGKSKDEVYKRLQEFGGLDKRLLNFIEGHKKGYKIGMISNVGQGFIDRMFMEHPAEYYFDSLVLSSNVGLVKPDVRIYELSAQELGCEPRECVFIDDLKKNVDGAIAAGMQAIHYAHFDDFIEQITPLISDTNDEGLV